MRFSLFLLLFFQFSTFADTAVQDVDIVADSTSVQSLSKVRSFSTVLTEEDIRGKNYRTIYEAIKSLPGIDVYATTPGQNATIFIRGEKSEQTLVLIDGVEYNDPTDPGRGADYGVLPIDNIERIEVLRGAQSVQYPGVGGVIRIFTKNGRVPKTELFLEGGSFGSMRTALSTRGKSNTGVDYSLSNSIFHTDGISASATGAERDGTTHYQFNSRLEKLFAQDAKVVLYNRFFTSKSDLDNVPADSELYTAKQQNYLGRVEGTLLTGNFHPTLGFNLRLIERDSVNLGVNPTTHYNYSGDIEKVDLKSSYILSPTQHITFGLETERQHSHSIVNTSGTPVVLDSSIQASTVFTEYGIEQEEGLMGTAGIRGDYHSAFYFQPTARIAPAFRFASSGTTLKGSLGTGFKPPSLYQLYGEYGTTDLLAEKSVSTDFGIEQEFLEKRGKVVAAAFYNSLKDLVDFDLVNNRYKNIGKAWTAGLETQAQMNFTNEITVSTSYTLLHSRDQNTDAELLRRPRHRISNDFTFKPGPWLFTLRHQMTGERLDVDATTYATKSMPTYNLFHFYSEYKPFTTTAFHFRIENLFNTSYQSLDGYGTAGISFYGGLRQEL